MERAKRNIEESLLDWHLDRLGDEDRAWIEEELRRDNQLRARSDRLGKVLQPLDAWRVAHAPPQLADNVLAHLERSKRAGDGPQPLPADDAGRWRFPLPRLRNLVAVAACIVFLLGVSVFGLSELRDRSQRTLCRTHLASIFGGITTYQQDFAGSLPFAGFRPGARWLPTAAPGRSYASNSRHIYLLVKGSYGPLPKDFICAAVRAQRPMQVKDCSTYDDFAATCNISYASLNLAGPKPNLRPEARLAYVGDANPLFVNARFNASVDPDKANSPAHRRRGQNVLTLDGSARWMVRPVYGPSRDNLWLIGNIRQYKGTEAPVRDDDVQLVPGYPATDPEVSRRLAQ